MEHKSKSRRSLAIVALSCMSGLFQASPAIAEERGFFVNAGLGHVAYRPVNEISTVQGVVTGAGARTGSHQSVILEGGMFISDNWSIALSAGLPPKIILYGTGSIAQLGELGQVRYGSTALLLQRHFPIGDRVSLYAGAGPVYTVIFSTKGTNANDLRLSNEVGLVLQAGSKLRLSDSYSLFVDAKKTIIRSRSRVTIQQVVFTSSSHPSPLSLAAGISYRF